MRGSQVRQCKRCGQIFADRIKHAKECKKPKAKPRPASKWHKKRPGRKPNRGKDWPRIRRENLDHCEVCPKTELHQAANIHRDHIIPFRLAEKWGDPNAEVNLISICASCHGHKTPLERLIFEADFLGYALELIRLGYDGARLERAFRFYGLRWPLQPTSAPTDAPGATIANPPLSGDGGK